MRIALAALAIATFAGCYKEAEMDGDVLERLLGQQEQTQEALDTAVKALVSAARTGPVHVEKVTVEGGAVIFALWPDGDREIWGVADDGRTVSLAYDRNGSSKTLGDDGVSWIRK